MFEVLRIGAAGETVRRLQALLAAKGFAPGAIDGAFGPATEAAVLGFQLARDLVPDGIVGPVTWRALGEATATLPPVLDRLEVSLVARLFPSTDTGSIARNLPLIVGALAEAEMDDKPMALMALATIRAESETFEPVSEMPSRWNSSPGGHPFDLYDHRRDLGNAGRPDGARFRGRGFVQLTGRANYGAVGRYIGLGDTLLHQPEHANEPATAARILAAFLRMRQRAIKRALAEGDLVRARRLVNGGRHGLGRFTDCYRRGDALIDDPIWRLAA
ncbi:MAG: peptidoglycan-binding protein [Geminicoccaceae bacterium]|nr:peptidoglycan-binding protein [Geminicoccaceae bacterium]